MIPESLYALLIKARESHGLPSITWEDCNDATRAVWATFAHLAYAKILELLPAQFENTDKQSAQVAEIVQLRG